MKRCLVLAAALLAAACSPSATPTPAPPQRNPPTMEAPAWQQVVAESAVPVTAGNATQIALLGRLDQPETPSTLFDHTVSPDGTRLAALNNEEILAWDLLTGQIVFHTARASATRLFYASDKTELYAVDPNALVQVLDAGTGSTLTSFQAHNRYGGLIAFDPDNDRLAFGGQDGTVKVWDLFERQSMITLNAHTTPITALGFSGDGLRLATASGDGFLRLWQWEDGEQVAALAIVDEAPQRLAVSPDGSQVVYATSEGIWLWRVAEGSGTPLTLEGGTNPLLLYSNDGRLLLIGTRSTGLALWNAETLQRMGALAEVQGSQVSAEFSPDSQLLLTSAFGGGVALWNLAQTSADTLNRATLPTGAAQIYAVAWTDDSRLLLLFDATGPVYVWGVGTNSAG